MGACESFCPTKEENYLDSTVNEDGVLTTIEMSAIK